MELIFALVLAPPRRAAIPDLRRRLRRDGDAQEPKVPIEPRNTKGSTETWRCWKRTRIDTRARAGARSRAPRCRSPLSQLRIITAMYASPGVLMVRGDSP